MSRIRAAFRPAPLIVAVLSTGAYRCQAPEAVRNVPAPPVPEAAKNVPAAPVPEAAKDVPASPVLRPLPNEAFRVEWSGHTVPATMKAGAVTPVSVTVKNLSAVPWPHESSTGGQPPHGGAVRLGYRWWSAKSPAPMAWPRDRGNLKGDVAPGESATLTIEVTAPAVPGRYKLQLDLVQEWVAWFEQKGAAQLLVPIRVQ